MKKCILVLAVIAALAVFATPAFLQETEKPHAQHEHGTAGAPMPQGAMMCPMMGAGNTGMMGSGSANMMGAMGGMMGGMGGDPKMMGRLMLMRGEMMIKMGEVMIKHGKQMQAQNQK